MKKTSNDSRELIPTGTAMSNSNPYVHHPLHPIEGEVMQYSAGQTYSPHIQPPIIEAAPPPAQLASPPVLGIPIQNPPHMPPYQLLYPSLYSSQRPVSVLPIPVDYQGHQIPIQPGRAGGCIKRGIHSLTNGDSDCQLIDLTDERDPIMFKCAKCMYEGYTNAKNTLGPCTYMSALALCCICAPLGLIPCLYKRFQYIQHFCPNCTQRVAINYPG